MFSLLYGLWEYVFRKEELRVLIIGLDKSGKTTLLEKIKARSAEPAYRCSCVELQMELCVLPSTFGAGSHSKV